MAKKKQFSYQEKREHLENLLEEINSTVSFEKKETLYLEALEELEFLENYLNTQQEVISKIIGDNE